MNNSYEILAGCYDRFTDDVPYDRWADFLENLFAIDGLTPSIVLDLACGTGAITRRLAQRGYDMIGVDQSVEMLMRARENAADLTPTPLFLCQSMQELDLYGTVDACVCCLDSVNYVVDPAALERALARVHLFLAPGGKLIFDVNTRDKLQKLDGQCFVRQDEDTYCVWQADYEDGLCTYRFDLFLRRADESWQRFEEEHVERGYGLEEIQSMLQQAGFCDIRQYGELRMEPPRDGEERVFFTARKEE